jgi:hypothetical protein
MHDQAWAMVPRLVRHLLEFLRCESVIPAEKMSAYPLTPAERCAQGYEHHLREARGG